VADALLNLPAIRRRLAPLDRLELRLSGLELTPSANVVDLPRLYRIVDERDRPIPEHLKEPRARCELEHVRPVTGVDPCRAGPERRNQRRMPGQHADLPDLAGDDDQLCLALVRRSIRGDERDVELFAGASHSLRRREGLAALDGTLDRTDHVEGLLREIVVETVNDLLEAADRVLDLDVLTRGTGENLGDVERL